MCRNRENRANRNIELEITHKPFIKTSQTIIWLFNCYIREDIRGLNTVINYDQVV